MFFGTVFFWAVVAAVMLVVELLTTGLVTIWFCIGAVVALLATLVGAAAVVQVAVFVVVSALLLAATRPFTRKVLKVKVEPTNIDRIIGGTAMVTEEINHHADTGVIKVDGKEWTARCMDTSRVIPAGTEVIVVAIEGVKAVVK